MKTSPRLGLARKHRPQVFAQLVGQEAVAITLANAVKSDRPAQAYLFFGPKGVGKTTSARILAKALNCKKGPTPEPCGECPSCAEVAAGSSIDVLELDAASNTQVDKIREMIIETVALAPSRDRFKVFIIDEVHMLSASSFNALLKTLEEPPAHAVFILATTESAKLPPTIVSRCQRFRFRPIPRDVIAGQLAKIAKSEKIAAEPKAFDALARAAGGSLRDAVSLFEQAAAYGGGRVEAAKIDELLGTLPEEFQLGIVGAVLEKSAPRLTEWLARAASEGFDPALLLRDLRGRLSELYLHRLAVETDLAPEWRQLAAPHSPETFAYLLQRVNRTLSELREAESPQLSFELGLYGLLESAYDLREWVARLEALERRLDGAAGPPSSSAALGAPRESVRPAETPQSQIPAEPAMTVRVDVRTEHAKKESLQPENIWPAVLHRLAASKPALAGSLAESRLIPNAGGDWKLIFKAAFNKDRAQSAHEAIEAELSDIAGRKIKLAFEAQVPPRTAKAPQREKDDAPEGWVDPAEEGPPADPGVQKVLDVMGGRVKQVRKKP